MTILPLQMLIELGVERLVLPAISQLRETWVNVFGFEEMPAPLRQEFSGYPFLVFSGTSMFHKVLSESTLTECKSCCIWTFDSKESIMKFLLCLIIFSYSANYSRSYFCTTRYEKDSRWSLSGVLNFFIFCFLGISCYPMSVPFSYHDNVSLHSYV